MSRKAVKPQNINFGRQSPEHKHLISLLTGYNGGRYRVHELFRWMLDEVMRDAGNPLADAKLPPEDAHSLLKEAVSAYLALVRSAPPLEDVLGPLYMELACDDKYMGQYFTPWPVAKLCASLTLGNDDLIDRGEIIRACDPACGSGVMMLAFAQCVLERFGRAAVEWLSLSAVDLDPICARMTAVQFLANTAVHGFSFAELLVVHGDSLWPEKLWQPVLYATRRQTEVGRHVLHPHHPARKDMIRQAARSHPDLFPWYEEQKTA